MATITQSNTLFIREFNSLCDLDIAPKVAKPAKGSFWVMRLDTEITFRSSGAPASQKRKFSLCRAGVHKLGCTSGSNGTLLDIPMPHPRSDKLKVNFWGLRARQELLEFPR